MKKLILLFIFKIFVACYMGLACKQPVQLPFECLSDLQKKVHYFLCRQATQVDHGGSKNYFTAALVFYFKDNVQPLVLWISSGKEKENEIKTNGCFISKKTNASDNILKAEFEKEGTSLQSFTGRINIDKRLSSSKRAKLTRTKYRLEDSEMQFLYEVTLTPKHTSNQYITEILEAINAYPQKATLQCIELHGFTTRDMCPCCFQHLQNFLIQANTQQTNPTTFFGSLLTQLNQQNIPISFFISSLVELGHTEYQCSRYPSYYNTCKEKIAMASTPSEKTMHCVFLRKDGASLLSFNNLNDVKLQEGSFKGNNFTITDVVFNVKKYDHKNKRTFYKFKEIEGNEIQYGEKPNEQYTPLKKCSIANNEEQELAFQQMYGKGKEKFKQLSVIRTANTIFKNQKIQTENLDKDFIQTMNKETFKPLPSNKIIFVIDYGKDTQYNPNKKEYISENFDYSDDSDNEVAMSLMSEDFNQAEGNMSNVQDNIQNAGYRIQDVTGDGNCGFYAILQGFNPEQKYESVKQGSKQWNAAAELRRTIADATSNKHLQDMTTTALGTEANQLDFDALPAVAQHLASLENTPRGLVVINSTPTERYPMYSYYDAQGVQHSVDNLNAALKNFNNPVILLYTPNHWQAVLPVKPFLKL